ncbi:MAG: FAD-dependent oxidoreductase [Piscinibacter sp.]|nr:FAD-dependent oxidoreductase [Piscinibacter sp.]
MTPMQDADVLVVGGGLAGLTAAAELALQGLRCTAFTGPAPGGLLLSIESVQGLPEHPEGFPGYDLCPMAQEAGMDAGAVFVADEAGTLRREGEAWAVASPSGEWRAPAVVLASGSRLRALDVPGEARFEGKGVSHCASCDGPLLRGRPVAVVGGGDAACQEALALAAHAGVVHLLVRGTALRATEAWQQRVRAEPKIEVHAGSAVAAIDGEQAVQAVRLVDGRTLAVDAVFVYAGLLPNTEWLRGLVALDAAGRIDTDAQLRCSAPGLFAAGSVRAGHSGQAADALADGRAVARAVRRFLREE